MIWLRFFNIAIDMFAIIRKKFYKKKTENIKHKNCSKNKDKFQNWGHAGRMYGYKSASSFL